MATSDKYDRQLRLWGANGQRKLAECCVVLINATAAGTETLKNLVLPGIGSFHIIDDAQVSPAQRNEPFSNFFVFHTKTKADDVDSQVKSRAEIATQHLLELNPDVAGSFTTVDSLQFADYTSILSSLATKHSSLVVIAADLPSCVLLPISNLCWNGLGGGGEERGNNVTHVSQKEVVPLIIVKSYGLIGSVRVQTPYHPIIESKPDNPKPDLRLAPTLRNPASFPELQSLVDKTNLDDMDSKEHCHVPYVILLLKAVEKWRKEQMQGVESDDDARTRLPKTSEEKTAFQKTVSSLAKNMEQELNFIEAVKNYYLAYTDSEIPYEVQELLDSIEDNILEKVEITSTNVMVDTFDVLLLSLKKFIDGHDGFPPLNGSIPDMTASTKAYIDLQTVYNDRAERDKAEMRNILDVLTDQYGKEVIPTISDDELTSFCKNIYNLRLVRTRSFQQEYNFEYGDDDADDVLGDLIMATFEPYEVPEHTPLLWFIALRACEAFYDDYGHYPGQDGRELALESDACCVQKYMVKIVDKMNMAENDLLKSTLFSNSTGDDSVSDFAKEVTRYNNAEIHNIASIVGGVASQEAVKLITRQYIPMEGTYIYNGITGVAGTLKL